MLNIIWYIIVGFIIGLIASAIIPGSQHLGVIMTTLLGIAGSIVGGFIARLFSKPKPGSAFHRAGFILSILGAIIVLFISIKVHSRCPPVWSWCCKPVLSPKVNHTVTISEQTYNWCGQPGDANLRYTLDGSDPTFSGPHPHGTQPPHPGPWYVTITAPNTTLKARVKKDCWIQSQIARRTYP
jgi:uncharacterized membrane protein YeaQ/YmgE (transglycosylase-associated protein family)